MNLTWSSCTPWAWMLVGVVRWSTFPALCTSSKAPVADVAGHHSQAKFPYVQLYSCKVKHKQQSTKQHGMAFLGCNFYRCGSTDHQSIAKKNSRCSSGKLLQFTKKQKLPLPDWHLVDHSSWVSKYLSFLASKAPHPDNSGIIRFQVVHSNIHYDNWKVLSEVEWFPK